MSKSDEEREAELRQRVAALSPVSRSDVWFLLSMIERLRGALHESRKDREALMTRKVMPSLFTREWFVRDLGHFPTADEALAAYRSGNGETT